MSIHEPETVYVTSTKVFCDGDEGPLGHPRVYYDMGDAGYVDCMYCDRRYILIDGPMDKRGENAALDSGQAA
ncbi:MAG: zinc-finger domain-containing protein [Pseudomonadota bacterium]